MVKVALVGCGQIADAHLEQIRRVKCAELVGVCDQQIDLARQAGARFGVPRVFDDLGNMLETIRPDVLHVTTPPHTHHAIALRALGAGVHVYVEKPFAVNAAEADEMIDAADAAGRLACVGHDQLLDPTWLECRRLVLSGTIGRVVHVDSYQGYDLDGPFGRAFANDPDHWLRRLPGGLFQNVMSHALYRITNLAVESPPRVSASWFGEKAIGLPTELRATLLWPDMTAHLVFSSTARPIRRVAKIHGTRGGVEIDLDAQVIRRDWGATTPGAFGKLEVPIRQLREAAGNSATNIWRFLRARIHYFEGMRRLFESFYAAILENGQPPISYAAIRRDTAIMDEIFSYCRDGQPAEASAKFLPSHTVQRAVDGGL